MTISWDSLYLPSANQDAIVSQLHTCLNDLGYQAFDPFGIIPGKAYKHAVRLFVAPPVDGWVRIIGTPDPRMLATLTASIPGLYIALDDDRAIIQAYARSNLRDTAAVLKPYLREGFTLDHLRHALAADDLPAGDTDSIFDHLPQDIQALGGQVNPQQAQKMFERLSGNLMRKVGGDGDAARDLMRGADWNSPGGRRLQALMRCLTIPANWREPDFVTLRDAYQLHARRRRKPDARLYPGDEDIMARVPDALDYVPVYGGRDS